MGWWKHWLVLHQKQCCPNVTGNGASYRAMNTDFFIPLLNNHDIQELGFIKKAQRVTQLVPRGLMKKAFGNRIVSRFRPVNWPPISCYFTPPEYFLWGDPVNKSLAYSDKPETIDHLEDNICRVNANIRPQMMEQVIENRTFGLDDVRASGGGHMPEIKFKL